MKSITLPVITIRQPWAWLILQQQDTAARKDIENRNWKLPAKYIGKPVLVHTSASNKLLMEESDAQLCARGFSESNLMMFPLDDIEGCGRSGHIVGCVVFSACTQNVGQPKPSPWCDSDSRFWWHVREAYPITPVPAKGKLSFWQFEYPHANEIRFF
jgi:hypothetical protein